MERLYAAYTGSKCRGCHDRRSERVCVLDYIPLTNLEWDHHREISEISPEKLLFEWREETTGNTSVSAGFCRAKLISNNFYNKISLSFSYHCWINEAKKHDQGILLINPRDRTRKNWHLTAVLIENTTYGLTDQWLTLLNVHMDSFDLKLKAMKDSVNTIVYRRLHQTFRTIHTIPLNIILSTLKVFSCN